jgi:hypothetical protein
MHCSLKAKMSWHCAFTKRTKATALQLFRCIHMPTSLYNPYYACTLSTVLHTVEAMSHACKCDMHHCLLLTASARPCTSRISLSTTARQELWLCRQLPKGVRISKSATELGCSIYPEQRCTVFQPIACTILPQNVAVMLCHAMRQMLQATRTFEGHISVCSTAVSVH